MKNYIKTFNSFLLHLLVPSLFVFLSIFTFIMSYFGYEYDRDISYSKVLLIFLILFALLFFSIDKFYGKTILLDKTIILKSTIWKFVGLFILFINIAEFLLFGVPLLSLLGIGKFVIYAKYGLPLFHHIAVSSWLLLFIKYKNKSIEFLMHLFALLNPFLIVNRDLILLTYFTLFIKILLNNRKSRIPLFIVIVMVIAFCQMGMLRSGNALSITPLPIKSSFIKENYIIQWFYVYLTSSWYNFFNNIYSHQFSLRFVNINVFPESFFLYAKYDILGFIIFFCISYIFIILFSKLKNKEKELQIFYYYILYQSLMTIFSKKLYTTDTIYQIMVFAIVLFIEKNGKLFIRRIETK